MTLSCQLDRARLLSAGEARLSPLTAGLRGILAWPPRLRRAPQTGLGARTRTSRCRTLRETMISMAATITFRPDDDARLALEELTSDGTPVSTAVREALIAAAAKHAKSRLRAEAEALAADSDDRAEAAQVLQDMGTLRAW